MMENEILDLFREEAREHLSALERSLLDLESSDDPGSQRGIIDSAFRFAHCIKGSSRAVGLLAVEDAGQVLEDTLDDLREHPQTATPELIAKAIREFDAVRAAYQQWDESGGGIEIAPELLNDTESDDVIEFPESDPQSVDLPPTSSVDEEILALFREESQEHVVALETLLLDLEMTDDTGQRRGIIDDVFRHAHSLKGSARVIGLNQLQDLAQILEDTLDALRNDPEHVTQASIEKSLAEFDAVRQAYDQWAGGGEAAVSSSSNTAIPDEDDSSPQDSAEPKPLRPAKTSEERLVVRVSAERLDRMLSLAGEVRVSQRGSDALESQLGVINEVVAEALVDCKRFEEKMSRLDSVAGTLTLQELKEPADQIRSQVESAVERLRQLQNDFGKKRFSEELLVEELEQDIRTARLVPLANLTDSMRRAIRDLVRSLEKSISYQPDVGDILLDKAVMESLKDPLMHLVRNSADHGIEMPADRIAAGKSEEGTIAITASRRAESVLIRISDDGGGVKFDRIREKLKTEGGMDEAEVAALSEKELGRYLFQAGFTTKQEATAVSGRGVGMDVVVDSIHRLQGTVEIETSSPAGTTFLITVPVTISTARILTVNIGGQRYGIPTASMVRTGRLSKSTLRDIEGSLVLSVDGVPVRWVELSELLGLPSSAVWHDSIQRAYLLLLHEGRKIALAVDEFEDESEVILKSLEFPLTEMDEVIGGTIRPDGSVQLVLDPAWIMSRALRTQQRATAVETKTVARILVVDDSPTTRSIVRNVVSAAGYAVQTAADGVEALERIRTGTFDLVVSDVEMPRMNGFELTRQIKSQFKLPVVLVTGMEKEEDRLQGLKAGADAYLVKSSFEDQSLLEVIDQFV